jgi:hypothetical protein
MATKKEPDKEYDPNWGGARRGTGEETIVMRVPVSLAPVVKEMIDEHKKDKQTS